MKVKYGNRKFLMFIYVVLCITLAFVGTYALQKNSQLNLSGSLGYIKTKSYLSSDWQKQVTTTFAINKSAITEIEFVNKINLNNYPNIIKDGSTIKYASVGALGAEDSKASAVTNGIFTTGTTNVKAYCTPTSSGASTYLLIIYSPAKIYAPEDSSSLFMDLTGVKTISFDNFNTDYITKMGKTLNGTNYGMFYNCNALESLDLTNFITSSVTNMKYLFYGCQALSSLNLLNFNTSNVTDMSYMFTNCSLLVTLDVSNFNTEKVTTMENMFGGCNKVTSIILSSNFKTNKVTSMKNMFSNCFELKTLDLSNFDTSNVSDFYNMFLSDKSIAELDLSNFTIKNGAVVSGMLTLNSASKLSKLKTPTSANAITMSIVVGNPLVNEDTDELMTTVAEDTKFSGSFTLSNTSKTYISAVMMSSQSGWLNELSAINTTKFGTGGWNTQVKIKTICFESEIPSGYTYHDGDLPNGVQVWTKGQDDTNISFVHSRKIYAPVNAFCMFQNVQATTITFNNFDTRFTTNMQQFFNNCGKLESVDLSKFNTEIVSNFNSMFKLCKSLKELDISSFTIQAKASVSNMLSTTFYDSSKDTLTAGSLTKLITPKIVNTAIPFYTSLKFVDEEGNDVNSYTYDMNDTNTYWEGTIASGKTASETYVTIIEFPTDWENQLYVLGGISTITGICFEESVPSGYSTTPTCTLSTGIKVYKSNTKSTDIAFVYPTTIFAPVDSTDLFDSNKELISITFNNFDTCNTTNMSGMFGNCELLETIDISSFNTENVIDMTCMFLMCAQLESVDMSNLDLSNVSSFSSMFQNCYALKSININLNTSSAKDMQAMFVNCSALENLNFSNIDTSNVTDMSYMFSGCELLQELDLTYFDTFKVTNMSGMFAGCKKLTTLNLSNFVTTNVTDFSEMFSDCYSLQELDLSTIVINANVNTSNMLQFSTKGNNIQLTKLITPKTVNTAIDFYTSLKFVDENNNDVNTYDATNKYWKGTIASGKTASETYTSLIELPSDWADQISSANSALTKSTITGICFEKSIPSGYNTTPVCTLSTGIKVYKSNAKSTNIAFVYPTTIFSPKDSFSLFSDYYISSDSSALTSITFNNFNTKNTIDMSLMFYYCENLTELDLTNFDTSNVEKMALMFSFCTNLLSINMNFNTGKVNTMQSMFGMCSSLTELDLSGFNTSNVTDMREMFGNCVFLQKLNLSNFDTSNVTDMSNMFNGCVMLNTLNLSNFNTNKATNFESMFVDCISLSELNLSSFIINANSNTTGMLQFSTKSNKSQLTKLITPKTVNTAIDFYTSLKFVDENNNDVNTYDATNKYWKGTIASGKTASETYTSLIELPSDWADQISSANSALTKSTITGMRFEKSIPSGYNTTAVCTLSTGVGVYKSNSTATDIAFVYSTTIFAPKNSGWLFGGDSEYGTAFKNITFNNFSTINVTDMSNMFVYCRELMTLDLSSFDTNNVINMSGMFFECKNLVSINLSSFNTNMVSSLGSMFGCCYSLQELDFTYFDTSNVTDFSEMFSYCFSLRELDLSPFVIKANADTSLMLSLSIGSNKSQLTKLITPFVVNTEISFNVACNFLDEETLTSVTTKNSSDNYYTGKIATGSGSKTYIAGNVLSRDWFSVYENNNMTKDEVKKIIFLNAEESKALADKAGIEASDGSIPYGSKTDGYTIYMLSYMAPTIYMPIDSTELFANFTNLTDFVTSKQTINGITYQIPSTKYTQNMQSMFYNCSSLTNIDVSGFDTSKTTNMNYVFRGCKSLATLNLSNFSSLELKQAVGMFAECSNLKGITFGNTFTCEKVTTLSHMFWACNALESLDLTMLNTPLLQDCENMFKECSSVTGINFSNKFNTSNAKYFQGMFNGCSKLTGIDLSSFDTSNVLNMQEMFMGCSSLTSLNVSSFNTSRVTSMIYMFRQCSLLTSLDLSNFSSENLLDTGGMFAESKKLQSITFGSNFTCEKVTSMTHMFWDCNALSTLDLSMFNTPVLTNTNNMFRWCNNLTSITFGNNFNTSKVTNFVGMFSACYGLKSLDLRTFVINSGASVTDMLNFGSSNKSLFNFWAPKTIGVNIVLTLGWEMYYLSNIVTTNSSGNYTLTLTSTWNSRWLSHYATA